MTVQLIITYMSGFYSDEEYFNQNVLLKMRTIIEKVEN